MTGNPSIPSFTLRSHQPGDMGYITYRHGAVYAKEYGFDHRLESLVARITADFLDNYKPDLEGCWIAEKDGAFLGCVMLVEDKKPKTAKLRLLLVDEKARGLGVGSALIQKCIDFSREAGYKHLDLWTQNVLEGARRLYSRAGFKVVKTQNHDDWGVPVTGEYWALKL